MTWSGRGARDPPRSCWAAHVGGTTRVIAYIDADVDLEVAADPVLPEVGWAWLNEALTESDASADALGGTVTQVFSLGPSGSWSHGNRGKVPSACIVDARRPH